MKPGIIFDDQGWPALTFPGLGQIDFNLNRPHGPYTKKLNGKQELIAKACGLNAKIPKILDLTFGLGQDAWTLGRLGAQVVGVEREPLLVQIFNAALEVAGQKANIKPNHLKLICSESKKILQEPQLFNLGEIDVIYFDPMYPEDPKKTALPRKEMQLFRDWLGSSSEVETQVMLEMARQYIYPGPKFRVVVKRPLRAPALAPDFFHQFKGKTVRFDCYKGFRK